MFLKTLNGDLRIISSYSTEFNDIKEGYKLVYLGKAIEVIDAVDEEVQGA